MRRGRFEVARTDDGFTARFIARNGKQVWTTGSQVYSARRGADNAIDTFVREFFPQVWVVETVVRAGSGMHYREVELRRVDERTAQ